MCGVFAVSDADHAARTVFLGLFALQHRGQESAGITAVSPTGILCTHKNDGLVAEVFKPEDLDRLPGRTAIGHVRYSTAGGVNEANVQPLTARIGGKPMALAHNGNIVNAEELRLELEDAGTILHGTADTEIVLHLMARSRKSDFEARLCEAISRIEGAFTSIVLTQDMLFGYVDRFGYRPLVLGQLDNGWILASETCALDLVGARFVRDIRPGELVSIDLATQQCVSRIVDTANGQPDALPKRARCVFEHIYFGRPDSRLWGMSSLIKRTQLGEALAKDSPAEADLVMAIPDSGVPIAMGYSAASGIPYQIGLIRNHYVGRTFIEPAQITRNFRVKLKLNPVREIVAGKRLVVVDDSIVRGTTSKRIIEILREAGAKEVHVRVGSPQVKFPCYYGIDTPKRRELLAQTMTLDEMRAYLGADSLAFLNESTLVKVMTTGLECEKDAPSQWCISCFNGRYQDRYANQAVEDDIGGAAAAPGVNA
jgi:amidophosphoribosyltransferase